MERGGKIPVRERMGRMSEERKRKKCDALKTIPFSFSGEKILELA